MTDSAPGRLEESEVDLEQVGAASDVFSGAAVNSDTDRLDFFITRDGTTYAGSHLIVDLWGANRLDELEYIEQTLVAAAEAAGATVLSRRFHHFTPNGGVSGVVVLAESHISIHTWPEASFAALDVFMCGDCRPSDTVPTFQDAFQPTSINVSEVRRGLMPGDAASRRSNEPDGRHASIR